jgi:hypothetical protein
MADSFFQNKKRLTLIIAAAIAVITSVLILNKKSTTAAQERNNIISSDDSVKLAEFYKKEIERPCIHPPFPNVNIPYTNYKINAANAAKLTLKTGSVINIPKNAFVDAEGKKIQGEVELRFREFHNPVDFFVAGIPMTYDSAGVRYHFESAGMIEIVAFQNNKKINIAPEKSIDIELASKDKDPKHNLYVLDTTKNNWSCLGKDKIVSTKNKEGNKAENPAIPGTVEKEYKQLEEQQTTLQKEKETQLTTLQKTIAEPTKPVKALATKYNFNIDVDASEFPELSVYKGLLFQVGDENKNFNESSYNVVWDDASIKEGTKKGENYLLTLKKSARKYSLIVYPVFDGKNYEAAKKIYEEKYKKYTALLDKRAEDEKRIEAAYQAKLAALKKQEEILKRKFEDESKQEFNRLSTQEKVKRVFAINSFGVYNCDHAMPYPTGVSCIASLTLDNKQLMCYDVFLVDSAKNALFNFYKNPVMNFSFNPQSKNTLWTVENGVLYWLSPQQFSTIQVKNGIAKLVMSKVEKKFKTAEEIKAFFNL